MSKEASIFSHAASAPLGDRTTRRWLIVALVLTLIALFLGLVFVFATSGGTLFLFSTAAPIFVFVAVAIVFGLLFYEFRRTHRLFTREQYSAGAVIIRQEDIGDCAYFVRRGILEVVREEDGSIVATLRAGDYFGEMALITNSPRTATVRTVTDVELAVLGKRNFLEMMRLLPSTKQAILETLRERAMRRFRVWED